MRLAAAGVGGRGAGPVVLVGAGTPGVGEVTPRALGIGDSDVAEARGSGELL